jgi:hypothetical protein
VHVFFLYLPLSYFSVHTSFFNLVTNIIISVHPKYKITDNLHDLFDTICFVVVFANFTLVSTKKVKQKILQKKFQS